MHRFKSKDKAGLRLSRGWTRDLQSYSATCSGVTRDCFWLTVGCKAKLQQKGKFSIYLEIRRSRYPHFWSLSLDNSMDNTAPSFPWPR